jgi:predicted peroxiredoxin
MLRRKKLGILISAHPERRNFWHGIRLAEAAVKTGVDVYVYSIDDAVAALEESRLQNLKSLGVKLFVCAYSAQLRDIPITDAAVFTGLALLSDIVAGTDRFVSFN